MGIFALLDEESLLGKGTDKTLLNKFNAHLSSNPHFVTPDISKNPKARRDTFCVQHYAGIVCTVLSYSPFTVVG